MISWQQRAAGEGPILGCLSCAGAGSLFTGKHKQLFLSTPHSSAGFRSPVVVSPYGTCEDHQREFSNHFTSSFWQGEWTAALIV